jgi:hypothetical protein
MRFVDRVLGSERRIFTLWELKGCRRFREALPAIGARAQAASKKA